MTNVFTLAALRAEADKKYAPVRIDLGDETVVELRPLLRLEGKAREEVLAHLKLLNKDDAEDGDEQSVEDGLEHLKQIEQAATRVIEVAADKDARKLLRALGGDVALLLQVIEGWLEDTQPGEAQSSPN